MLRSAALCTGLMALAIAGCERAGVETQQQEVGVAAAPARAGQGDTMWVVLSDVKPDKREQFERFVEEFLIPAVEELAATDEQVMRQLQQTRTLYPTEPNEDGTYTYVWLMDPVVSGADYSFRGLFSRVYTAEETEQYVELFNDALERPQHGYVVVQQRPQL